MSNRRYLSGGTEQVFVARASPVYQEHPLYESVSGGFGESFYWKAAARSFSQPRVFRCFEALKVMAAHAD